MESVELAYSDCLELIAGVSSLLILAHKSKIVILITHFVYLLTSNPYLPASAVNYPPELISWSIIVLVTLLTNFT